MSERIELLNAIASEIKEYRKGEIAEPTPEHVDRWARQFTEENQLSLLREFSHVIKNSFLTQKEVNDFLYGLTKNENLAGKNPKEFWKNANFLDVQQNGQSQKEMLKLFDSHLKSTFEINMAECGSDKGDFIYLDDILFSGQRIQDDLTNWIQNHAPQTCTVHVILVANHASGQFYTKKKLNEIIHGTGKSIKIKYWLLATIENRFSQKNTSNVLWPAVIPNSPDVKTYIDEQKKFPFTPRTVLQPTAFPFSSEAGRQILEREFLIAGVKIRAKSANPKQSMRPLGFSSFGIGFGSTIATYRNCPNNCPLALWWGDPLATEGAFHWYPLLPRKTYTSPENIFG